MIRPIPTLEDYGLTAKHGFLPSDTPVTELPAYFAEWESVVKNLQALILTGRLRESIARMPVLSTDRLSSAAEWRRAYSILGFMLHGYIWGGEKAADVIPPSLSIPLLSTSEYLELPPVATFAGVCLWNYKPLFPNEPADSLENLATLCTFTGSLDEQWFYLVSVAIEARGAESIPVMLNAISAAHEGDSQTLTNCLNRFAEIVDAVNVVLQQMYRHCDPHVFYNRIRPYLAGSKNMPETPRGIFLDQGSGKGEFKHYRGGSNAQSSLIQFFDIVLGVQHRPTGETRQRQEQRLQNPGGISSSSSDESGEGRRRWHNFLMEMRTYMPGPHRRFLEHVSSVANIHEYVRSNESDQGLVTAFNAAVAMVKALRTTHITMVSRYIVVKSREKRPAYSQSEQASASDPAEGTSRAQQLPSPPPAKKLRGTGGTALIPFLKQARDETGEAAIGDWGKQLLDKAGVNSAKVTTLPKVDEHADGQMEVVGLAGTWSMDAGEGGLCHW